MSLNAKNKTGTAKQSNRVPQPNLEAGAHAARLVQVIDLGLQPQRAYRGQAKEPVDMLYVTYEMSHDFMVDEKGEPQEDLPRWISEDFAFYSLEADKAKSTLRYNALDPEGKHDGNWPELLGAPCSVLIVHNPKKKEKPTDPDQFYDNVGNVSPPVKLPGYVQPPLVNPPVFFDLSEPDLEVFAKLPTFLQERIKGNLNYNGSLLQQLLGEAPTAAPAAAQEEAATNEEDGNPY